METKNYASPTAEVVDVEAEGVFCSSPVKSLNMEEWEEHDFVW